MKFDAFPLTYISPAQKVVLFKTLQWNTYMRVGSIFMIGSHDTCVGTMHYNNVNGPLYTSGPVKFGASFSGLYMTLETSSDDSRFQAVQSPTLNMTPY